MMFKEVTFSPLKRSDFPLLKGWLSEPHVNAWWHQALDLNELESKYGPRIDGTAPVHVYVIVYGGRPIGFIQWYRWADYPNYAKPVQAEPGTAGIDLAIGEPDMFGLGIGPIVIRKFDEQIIFSDPGMKSVTADPAAHNTRSVRAFEKAGFSRTVTIQRNAEDFERQLMCL